MTIRAKWNQSQWLAAFLFVTGMGLVAYAIIHHPGAKLTELFLGALVWCALFVLLAIFSNFEITKWVVIASLPVICAIAGGAYRLVSHPFPHLLPSFARVSAPAGEGTLLAHLEYKSVGTVAALLPADRLVARSSGGAGFLGYSVTPHATHSVLHVHLTANAYAEQANEVVLAVFQAGQAMPIELFSKPIEAGGRVLFDERFAIDAPNTQPVSLDIRMGVIHPGQVEINGPAAGAPHAGVPYPTLTITETAH